MGRNMSQASRPTGFLGKLIAMGMARGHKLFYDNTARVLDLRPDDEYLEIGFGSGMFIRRYARCCSRIAGLDYSSDMVKMAREINKEMVETGKAEFKQGEASLLPWDDDQFTAATAIETFFFWSKPEKALREISRVLRPGGRLVIEMAYNKDDGIDRSRHVRKMGLRLYSEEEMRNMLLTAGFKEVDFTFYRGLWLPFKGHVVPRGMVVEART
jgi:SAM-dependent methyltransferase